MTFTASSSRCQEVVVDAIGCLLQPTGRMLVPISLHSIGNKRDQTTNNKQAAIRQPSGSHPAAICGYDPPHIHTYFTTTWMLLECWWGVNSLGWIPCQIAVEYEVILNRFEWWLNGAETWVLGNVWAIISGYYFHTTSALLQYQLFHFYWDTASILLQYYFNIDPSILLRCYWDAIEMLLRCY